jgi:inorganic pyrophosphatase
MSHPWHDVALGDHLPGQFTAVIEIPMGSSVKYENVYREADELSAPQLAMLRRFFQDYKVLEGRSVVVNNIQPAGVALPIIADALRRYTQWRRGGVYVPSKIKAGPKRKRPAAGRKAGKSR